MSMKKTIAFLLVSLIICVSMAQSRMISMEDLYEKHQFKSEKVFGLRSMDNGMYYTRIKRDEQGHRIVKYNYANGDSVATLFNAQDFPDLPDFTDYSISNDERKMLITTQEESIYRHSSRAHVWVYDMGKNTLTQISKNGKQRSTTFSPDAKMVAFVRGNNLYTYHLSTNKETAITNDGKLNSIINGVTDWVYEEEFAIAKAFQWAPDNKHIAYYKFDESQVKEFNLIMYNKQLYPTDYRYKYPKAGEDNSKVAIYMYNINDEKSVKSNYPDAEYVPRIKWVDAGYLAIQTLNRLQNKLNIYFLNAKTNTYQEIYNEESETYVEIIDQWYFLNDTKEMIITSESDGYAHLHGISYGKHRSRQLTFGNWDVTDFYGVSEQDEMAYYQSAEKSPTQRQIYALDLKTLKSKVISGGSGWNSAQFSANFLFYIHTYSNANRPPRVGINQNTGNQLISVIDNDNLVSVLDSFDISQKKFITIPTRNGVNLNGWVIKPPHFDSTQAYPVLVTIYGGPGSQTVRDVWESNVMWYQMLAQKGYIIVSVDNRGTGARGADFKKSTYLQMGKLEVEDYIETAKYLGNKPYVDAKRIGIWGWSYGGFMSTLTISKGADYYKTAIAVAPVTNWRYYDNIYTERYMRTPQENPAGYDDNSPINFVEKIKGKFLLVHGTADDNVHFQNTAELTRALVAANVQYEFYMYTDKIIVYMAEIHADTYILNSQTFYWRISSHLIDILYIIINDIFEGFNMKIYI